MIMMMMMIMETVIDVMIKQEKLPWTRFTFSTNSNGFSLNFCAKSFNQFSDSSFLCDCIHPPLFHPASPHPLFRSISNHLLRLFFNSERFSSHKSQYRNRKRNRKAKQIKVRRKNHGIFYFLVNVLEKWQKLLKCDWFPI